MAELAIRVEGVDPSLGGRQPLPRSADEGSYGSGPWAAHHDCNSATKRSFALRNPTFVYCHLESIMISFSSGRISLQQAIHCFWDV
jgi:hypothetical protein